MTLSVAPRSVYLRCELRVGFWDGLTPPAQYSDPMNFTKAELTSPKQEVEKLISNMTSNYGSALDSQAKPTDAAQGSFEFSTMPPKMLALVLGADVSEVTQAISAITDEAVTLAVGIWVPLANRYIDGTGLTVKTAAGSTTIDPSKYAVDLVAGMIKATDASAAGAMKVSYSKVARTVEQYAAGQAKSAYVHLTGQATDMVSGKVGILDIWKASLAPSGAVDAVKGGYFAGALSGDLIAPSNRASPWQWQAVTA